MQPSKLMRLLSSNEEDANILSSPSECVDRARQQLPFWELLPAESLSVLAPASLWLARGGVVGVCPPLYPTAARFPALETLEVAVISPSGLELCYPDPSPAQGAQLAPPHPSAQ